MHTQQSNSHNANEYQRKLTGLLNGSVKAAEIVGRGGYVHPKSVASSWLRKQLYKALGNVGIDELHVSNSGKGFLTENHAKRSPIYESLVNGEYRLLSESFRVAEFDIIALHDGGFGIAVTLEVKKSQ